MLTLLYYTFPGCLLTFFKYQRKYFFSPPPPFPGIHHTLNKPFQMSVKALLISLFMSFSASWILATWKHPQCTNPLSCFCLCLWWIWLPSFTCSKCKIPFHLYSVLGKCSLNMIFFHWRRSRNLLFTAGLKQIACFQTMTAGLGGSAGDARLQFPLSLTISHVGWGLWEP